MRRPRKSICPTAPVLSFVLLFRGIDLGRHQPRRERKMPRRRRQGVAGQTAQRNSGTASPTVAACKSPRAQEHKCPGRAARRRPDAIRVAWLYSCCRTLKITDERHPAPPESPTDVRAAHSVHRLVRHRSLSSIIGKSLGHPCQPRPIVKPAC